MKPLNYDGNNVENDKNNMAGRLEGFMKTMKMAGESRTKKPCECFRIMLKTYAIFNMCQTL